MEQVAAQLLAQFTPQQIQQLIQILQEGGGHFNPAFRLTAAHYPTADQVLTLAWVNHVWLDLTISNDNDVLGKLLLRWIFPQSVVDAAVGGDGQGDGGDAVVGNTRIELKTCTLKKGSWVMPWNPNNTDFVYVMIGFTQGTHTGRQSIAQIWGHINGIVVFRNLELSERYRRTHPKDISICRSKLSLINPTVVKEQNGREVKKKVLVISTLHVLAFHDGPIIPGVKPDIKVA